MSDATNPIDAMAARIAALEAALARAVAAHAVAHAKLDEVAAERDRSVRERDALREAYELLQQQAELARRRLVIAKAERIDTTQLELECYTCATYSACCPTGPASDERHLELAPRYWPITRRRLDQVQLAAELGPLTVPTSPLPTMLATSAAKSDRP